MRHAQGKTRENMERTYIHTQTNKHNWFNQLRISNHMKQYTTVITLIFIIVILYIIKAILSIQYLQYT